MSARSLARFIILSRSRANAFLLSWSSSGGIALNTPSIAMSFASAKLTFICCNSCSILSNVRLDNSFSQNVNERHYGDCTSKRKRRSRRIRVAALNRPTASVCFRQNQPFIQVPDNRRPTANGQRPEAAIRHAQSKTETVINAIVSTRSVIVISPSVSTSSVSAVNRE